MCIIQYTTMLVEVTSILLVSLYLGILGVGAMPIHLFKLEVGLEGGSWAIDYAREHEPEYVNKWKFVDVQYVYLWIALVRCHPSSPLFFIITKILPTNSTEL